jgi:hypothetical protein
MFVFQVYSRGHWFMVFVKPDVQNIEIVNSINIATKSNSLEKILTGMKPLIDLLTEDDKLKKESKLNTGKLVI